MNLMHELANAIRFLSIDAVEKAQSGHPGMPLGMADIATVLWSKFLRHNPRNPQWFNRDRFVLSNGHGSMLLYSLLHLTGYNLTIADLQNFRQLHSKTPGHPEYGETPGVETTTGPLAQGLAAAVGMAIAEKLLASKFNKKHFPLVDHYTYTFVGDGCLMEGLSHEVCSLAGTLGLGKLIVFYDDNGISIDGKVDSWFTDNTALRFESYNWQVIGPIDGHDPLAIEQAIKAAQQELKKPSLIICETIIGFGSPVAATEKAHGSPLGKENVAQVRQALGWEHPPFIIPNAIYAVWNHVEKGSYEEKEWLALAQQYKEQYPTLYHEFLRCINGDLPEHWDELMQGFIHKCCLDQTPLATRKSSQRCIEHFAQLLPEMFGGSADLTSSNNTDWSESLPINKDNFAGNYLYYGVREFGMAAIMNGLAVHGGVIPYGGTFLVFADYARNAIRLSALMRQRVIYVFTHDSVGLGEDGPTHQPIEHIAMLRMTPNVHVWRPADLVETAVAWQQALESPAGPSCLLLSRQNLPALPHCSDDALIKIKRGGYILYGENEVVPDAIILATGSEVHLALAAAKKAEALGLKIRVVSMPCCERFLSQDLSYQEQVLPKAVTRRIAIEAASSLYWYRFVGSEGKVIGIDRFGLSAPADQVFKELNITVEYLMVVLHSLL